MPQNLPELEVTNISIEQLDDYENNSKIHTGENIEAIKNSIEDFGYCDPMSVWQKPDGRFAIIEGHGRKQALEELGYTEAPCIVLKHLDDAQRRAYVHAHNQTTLMTGLDEGIVYEEIEELPQFDFTRYGFEEFSYDVNDLFDAEEKDDAPAAEDEPAEPLVCPQCGYEFEE